MLIGYYRSSTHDQKAGFDAQAEQLRATGCTRLFSEMVSSVRDREQLRQALDFVRKRVLKAALREAALQC